MIEISVVRVFFRLVGISTVLFVMGRRFGSITGSIFRTQSEDEMRRGATYKYLKR
jgi:hypothetical protein